MSRLRTTLSATALALAALCTAGGERAIFGFANRDLSVPETTAVFANLGLSLDIYRSRGTRPKSVPTVLFFYGCGWRAAASRLRRGDIGNPLGAIWSRSTPDDKRRGVVGNPAGSIERYAR